jgi:thymidylate synthase (FAD)
MANYGVITAELDNDTAGYVAPQGLRNVLIMQGNHQAWEYFIKLRGCNKNTQETQYITMRIWEELLKTNDGPEMFDCIGPDCLYGKCREGNTSCHNPIKCSNNEVPIPTQIIAERWPLLN